MLKAPLILLELHKAAMNRIYVSVIAVKLQISIDSLLPSLLSWEMVVYRKQIKFEMFILQRVRLQSSYIGVDIWPNK